MNCVRIVAFLAFVALAAGQFYPSNATQLFLNSTTSGLLTPQLNTNNAFIPDLYYLYLPENILNVTFTFTQALTGLTGCNPLDYIPSSEGAPCSDYAPFGTGSGTNAVAFCNRGDGALTNSNGTASFSLVPGRRSGRVGVVNYELSAGGYFYLSVSRNYYYSNTEFNKSCSYSIRVDSFSCPSGYVAIGSNSATNNPDCVPVNSVGINTNNITYSKLGSYYQDGEDVVYKIVLPENVGNVRVSASGNSSIGIYGNNRAVIRQGYELSACYDTSSYNYGTQRFEAEFVCNGVKAGNFFITLYSSDVSFGEVNITTQVCAEGTAGTFCNDTFIDLSTVILNGSLTVQRPSTGGIYGYVDVTNNITLNQRLFIFASGNSSSYIYFTRGGFPTSAFYAYVSFSTTPRYSALQLTQLELNTFVPTTSNRIYYFIEPYTSSGTAFVTLTSNATTNVLPSTTGVAPPAPASTGSTPVVSTTGSTATGTPVVGTTGSTATGTPVVGTTGSTATGTPVVATTGSTGMRMTTGSTGVRMTSGSSTGARMTTGAAAVATTASASMVIPSFIVAALIALLM